MSDNHHINVHLFFTAEGKGQRIAIEECGFEGLPHGCGIVGFFWFSVCLVPWFWERLKFADTSAYCEEV